MRYIEAVEPLVRYPGDVVLFLAGGITGCPDWQAKVLKEFKLLSDKFVIVSPRRADFPINDPSAAEEQIMWEFDALRFADVILFWFPEETLCPIALYELGCWTVKEPQKEILVGVHPGYKRRLDVVIQTKLERPGVTIYGDLHSLTAAARSAVAGLLRG